MTEISSEYVFTSRAGTLLDPRNVNRHLDGVLLRAGLPHQRFHDLRHCYATELIKEDIDLAVVSRLLGHADLSTTADVYAHLTKRMTERAAERMDAVLTRRTGTDR